MEPGKWMVNNRGKLYRLGRFIEKKRLVYYLDDHTIFSSSVKKLLSLFIPNLKFVDFTHGDDAWAAILNSYKTHSVPDVIISDILHPGISGYKLVRSIREHERRIRWPKPVPIVILSFQSKPNPYLDGGTRVYRYCKSSEIEDVVEGIELALYGEFSE